MNYLVFTTRARADTAQAIISSNMGLGSGTTIRYAIPEQTLAGSWAFVKPEDRYMAGVDNFTEIDDPEFPISLSYRKR
jgi:hypothetical protein